MSDTPKTSSMAGGEGPGAPFWLIQLRARFVAVARRRVPAADVEDVVQDALRVVAEKGSHPGRGPGDRPLPSWCFQVLRNTIGNYYQRRRVRERIRAPISDAWNAADPAATPLEALISTEAEHGIRAALDALEKESATCGRYLRRLLEGVPSTVVARAEGLGEAVLYRRVYRCRVRLRAILLQRGIAA